MEVLAPLRDATLVAFGFAGKAGVATVQYQPMVRLRQKWGGDILFELQLGGTRGLGSDREPDACRHSKYMGIDRHNLLVPDHRTDNICRLATYARKAV